MKELSRLKPPEGAVTSRKRLGRGPGSGLGKSAGKGEKGQNARSGGKQKRGFEGGQMPLQRRLPKRGFQNIFRKVIAEVNLRDLNRYNDGTVVNEDLLRESGLLKGRFDGYKILAKGKLEKALTIYANKFSESARNQIVAAGGKAEVIGGN